MDPKLSLRSHRPEAETAPMRSEGLPPSDSPNTLRLARVSRVYPTSSLHSNFCHQRTSGTELIHNGFPHRSAL